jgi:hypothetical protein
MLGIPQCVTSKDKGHAVFPWLQSGKRVTERSKFACGTGLNTRLKAAIAEQGQSTAVARSSLNKGIEENVVESLPASKTLVASAQKIEAEGRVRLEVGEELRRAEGLDIRHRHQNQRMPTHAQQALQAWYPAGHGIHPVSDLPAEVKQLQDERIQWLALRNSACEQRD